MNLTFNAKIVDAAIALRALKDYSEGKFFDAINALLEILDIEPNNWQARLMVGVCFYKTEQFLAAERTFRYIYEHSTDVELRQRSCEGLHSTRAKLEKNSMPPEHATYFQQNFKEPFYAWLDGAVQRNSAMRSWRASYLH